MTSRRRRDKVPGKGEHQRSPKTGHQHLLLGAKQTRIHSGGYTKRLQPTSRPVVTGGSQKLKPVSQTRLAVTKADLGVEC